MNTMITVVCPTCGNSMRAATEYLGRTGRCPSCKAIVEIRAPSGTDSLVTLQPDSGKTKTSSGVADSSGWMSALIGAGLTVIVYGLILALKNTYVGKVFESGGKVSFINLLVTCWGVALLALKFISVKRQQSYAELELELIPLDIGLQITPSNVDQFLAHLARQPAEQRTSILGRRILGALEHLKSRNSVPEVQQFLATQSEIDASSVDSGYTLLRSFIWVNPILGFIGTVLGIGIAVGSLATSVQGGGDIMQGLGGITAGLATAFDTTLIGLVMATILLFPTEMLRKSEYAMLDRIEAFANESLLRRMAEDRAALDPRKLPEVVRDALSSAFAEHQRWLAQWQAQVAELGRLVGNDLEQAAYRVQERMAAAEASRAQQYQDLTRMIAELLNTSAASTIAWQKEEPKAAIRTEGLLQVAKELEGALNEAVRLHQALLERQSHLMEHLSSGDLPSAIGGLRDEVRQLGSRLDGGLLPLATEVLPVPNYPKGASQTEILDGSEPVRRGRSWGLWRGGRT